MKCIICGKESEKPVCEICTKKIIMDYPFLVRRSLCLGDFSADLNRIEKGVLFDKDIEKLNEMAKKEELGEKVDYEILTKASLYFHRRFSFYLENFEIEENYYLNLGERYASKMEGEKGKYLKFQILREKGEKEEAMKTIEELATEYKKREYMIEYGKILVESGMWGHAIEIYNEILKENRNDIEVWKLLSHALFKGERYEDAERGYLKVLEMNQDDYESWYYRGLCLKNMGKWGGALQSFQTAVRKNPKFKEGYEEMLDLLLNRGMYTRALGTLKKMKELGFDVDNRIKELEGRLK